MNDILKLFTDHTFRIILLSVGLLSISSSFVGTFTVLKKESLLSDAIGHSSLAGVCLSFILFRNKDTIYLLSGAFIIGIVMFLLMNFIKKFSKIKEDSSMAILLTGFFGFGLALLSYISRLDTSKKSGLNKFIFGQASTILSSDLKIIIVFSLLSITVLFVFFKEFKISVFDKDYAKSIGINSKLFLKLISLLLVINVIIGIQVVGTILIGAFLIIPSVTARMWVKTLEKVVYISVFVGMLSTLVGVYISSNYSSIPTGPIIVVIMSLFVFISLIISPKGILKYYIDRYKFKRNTINEIESKKVKLYE